MRFGWWTRLASRPAARDAGFAAVWAVLGLVLWAIGAHGLWSGVALVAAPSWVFLVTLALAVAAVTQRSAHPFAALAACCVVGLADLACGGSLGVVIVLTDLIYAAMKYGRAAAVRLAVRVAALCGVAAAVALLVLRPGPAVSATVVQWGLIVLVSGLWGWNVRSEGERTRAVLAAEHASETRLLRGRIAHELHDLVANEIAVAGLHVEAAKLQAERLTGDTAPLARSLASAKRGTDEAHRELRGLIAVLTAVEEIDGPEPVRPAAGLAGLGALLPAGRALAWERGAGERLLAALESAEEPARRVVLRVLRELVANAAKHGTGDVRVAAAEADGRMRVELRNGLAGGGAGRSGLAAQAGSGLGIGGSRLLLGGIGGELDSRRDRTATPECWAAVLSFPAAGTDAGRAAGEAAGGAAADATGAGTELGGTGGDR